MRSNVWYLSLILVISVSIMGGASCSDDDESGSDSGADADTDSDSDTDTDADTDSDGDCTKEDVCDIGFACGFASAVWSSVEECVSSDWSSVCSGDTDAMLSCSCDCLETDTDCTVYETCGNQCVADNC